MTLPNERRLAVVRTMDFLLDLMNPGKTPKVPKEIRERAYSCLRHYPSEYHMEQARTHLPTIFGEWDSEYTKPEADGIVHSDYYYDTERNR